MSGNKDMVDTNKCTDPALSDLAFWWDFKCLFLYKRRALVFELLLNFSNMFEWNNKKHLFNHFSL